MANRLSSRSLARRMAIFMLGAAAVAGPAWGQGFEMRRPDVPTRATGQILGGQPANPSVWPATLRFSTPGGSCTSTVVGPRVILTAAHCVDPGAVGTVRIGATAIGVKCDHHPDYDTDYRLDVALCLAQSDITIPDNGGYETLNVDPIRPAQGTEITLIGYGCRQQGGGGPSGVLYFGTSRVQTAADTTPYVITVGGAAVCFGDSGGGAYLSAGGDSRRLFGVNSRGDIITRSLLSAVAHPAIFRFISDWSREKNVSICGLDPALLSCRA